MRRITNLVLAGFGLLAVAAASANAQFYRPTTYRSPVGEVWPTGNLTPAQSAFVASYLAAVAGHDVERYKLLVHPASLACMRKANEDYFAPALARRQGRTTLAQGVTVESLPPSLGLNEAAAGIGIRYPVVPTHAYHIDLAATSSSPEGLVTFAVAEGDSWYEVLPCPGAKLVGELRAARARAAADSATARKLATSLTDPVRTELMTMLQEGRAASATARYAEISGVELGLAQRVILALKTIAR